MSGKRLTVNETAKLLGRTPQAIRIQMQRGILPIGYVEKSITGTTGMLQYIIYEDLVKKYIGERE